MSEQFIKVEPLNGDGLYAFVSPSCGLIGIREKVDAGPPHIYLDLTAARELLAWLQRAIPNAHSEHS